MSDGSPSTPWDHLENPRVAGLAGLVLFGFLVTVAASAERPLAGLYPATLVGAALLLARHARDSSVALAGCAGLALGGVLEAVAVTGLAGTALVAEVLALAGFLVYLVGR
jgi:hypothetical protein